MKYFFLFVRITYTKELRTASLKIVIPIFDVTEMTMFNNRNYGIRRLHWKQKNVLDIKNA